MMVQALLASQLEGCDGVDDAAAYTSLDYLLETFYVVGYMLNTTGVGYLCVLGGITVMVVVLYLFFGARWRFTFVLENRSFATGLGPGYESTASTSEGASPSASREDAAYNTEDAQPTYEDLFENTPLATASSRTPLATASSRTPLATASSRTPLATASSRTPLATASSSTPLAASSKTPLTASSKTPLAASSKTTFGSEFEDTFSYSKFVEHFFGKGTCGFHFFDFDNEPNYADTSGTADRSSHRSACTYGGRAGH